MEPRTAPQPQARVPESPAGPILRLSIVVYALVILTTLLAIGVWMWTGHTFKSGESERVDSSHGPSSSQGMIYIPAGTFLAGPDKHPAMLNAFYIDATEVTAGEFCEIMHCPMPPASPNRPMVNVTVAQARQYAMREKKRLPTPLEWERAARGTNGNFYPWGDDADPALANVRDNPSLGGRNLVPAKSFQAYPEYQMAGNAWEMVEGRAEPGADDVAAFATLLQPPPTATEAWIAVRGGSFREPLMPDTLTKARLIPARYSAPDIGFRCVKDP